MKDGRPVLRKGYGLAEVELGVPIRPDMVFRVGSATKQFTAACVLKLVEQGRIALADPITRFLPDYPVGGHTVTLTLEQLLTHTSGIRNYNEVPAWFPHMREDWTPAQLIDSFKNEPFDFEPGSGWRYDNSGYVLLGAILEKVTGKAYADIVAEWIFEPLGMKDSRYGADGPIIPRRVAGYQKTAAGVVNAPYLSMTQPLSAGGLVSTVDDLGRWQAALDAGKVLSPASLERWWTPATLPDGTSTRYGYGWIVWSYAGHPVIEHGGSINGFTTANMRLPDDRVYAAVLSNCGGCADVRALALRAVTILIGRPFDERPTVTLPAERLDRFAGTYRDREGDDWVVTRDGDHLVLRAGPRTWDAYPYSDSEFLFRDAVRTVRFVGKPGEPADVLEIDERVGPIERARRAAGP